MKKFVPLMERLTPKQRAAWKRKAARLKAKIGERLAKVTPEAANAKGVKHKWRRRNPLLQASGLIKAEDLDKLGLRLGPVVMLADTFTFTRSNSPPSAERNPITRMRAQKACAKADVKTLADTIETVIMYGNGKPAPRKRRAAKGTR